MIHFNPHIDHLHRLVKQAEARQRVIGHNIANVNTPEFKALDLKTDPSASARLAPGENSSSHQVIERTGLAARSDGNNVDLDLEIAESHKNILIHQAYLQLLSGELSSLRRAFET